MSRKPNTQVSVPLRRQDGTPIPPSVGRGPTSPEVGAAGYWSPLTVTMGGVTELLFADGDAVVVWSPTP